MTSTSSPTPMFSPPLRHPGSTAVSEGPRSGRWQRAERLQSFGVAASRIWPPLAAKTPAMWLDQSLAMASRPVSRTSGGRPAAARVWLVFMRNWIAAVPGSGRAEAAVDVVRRPRAAMEAATTSALIHRRQSCTGVVSAKRPTRLEEFVTKLLQSAVETQCDEVRGYIGGSPIPTQPVAFPHGHLPRPPQPNEGRDP